MIHPGKLFIGLVLLFSAAVAARAGLLLSGSTAGFFQPISNPNGTIANQSNGQSASFRTGVPVDHSFKSGVKFASQNFHDIENGETFSLGLITYYNGLSKVGTSSGAASFDFYLDLDDPAVGRVHLTTITFGIDATVNCPQTSPDAFTTSFLQPPPLWLGDELVKFTINGLPSSTWVNENTWTNLGSVTVTATLIPEASAYASVLGSMILVFSFFRRRPWSGECLQAR